MPTRRQSCMKQYPVMQASLFLYIEPLDSRDTPALIYRSTRTYLYNVTQICNSLAPAATAATLTAGCVRRDRRHVLYATDLDAAAGKGTKGGLPTRARCLPSGACAHAQR